MTAGTVIAQDAPPAESPAEPAPAPEAAPPVPAETPKTPAPVTIVRKSKFEPADNERNPFWPIGWKREDVVVPPNQPARPVVLDLPRNQFTVTSILLAARPRLAVINGREYTEGDKIPTSIDGLAVEVKVKEITDGYIFFEFRDKLYRYPLRLSR